MNYFELYDLPVSFHPDQRLVKEQFYELSKRYHPDFHINSSAEKQEEVLELSTLNNKAFQVLKSPHQTLHYVLTLTGTVEEGENYSLPQSFLMEMMETNEALMDLEFDPDTEKLNEVKRQVAEIEKLLQDELKRLTDAFEGSNTETQKNLLLSIKDLFYRNKYLLRIKERLAKG